MKSLVFAACISAAVTVQMPAATVKASLKPPASRSTAPAFSLPDANGNIQRLPDYRGKVVVLNFWATDCGGCRLEIPWLVDIANTVKGKSVAVVGISMDISYEDLKNASDAWARVKPFTAVHGITYPILMGDEKATKAYDIQALPATYLIDPRGRIAATYVGLIDEQNVLVNVNRLLDEK